MTILEELSVAMADVSAHVLRSLVQVRSGDRGVGAGAVWRTDGLIVTSAHVVVDRPAHRGPRRTGGGAISVVLADGSELAAAVVAVDTEQDLAMLRVDAADLPPIALGDSRRLAPGDMVLALGFPWGVTGGATSGVVIGTGAALPELGGAGREWVAASLHLRPGHSGGPMVDSQGRLIGINTMMNGPDVGVAVPVHVVEAFVERKQLAAMV